MNTAATRLCRDIAACRICAEHLPLRPRPVLQFDPRARILLAGQAPGRKVHASGIPFDDASGERLRAWLGLSREQFYDAGLLAILPMGFCYPGTGKSGDLPPRRECAATWRKPLLQHLQHLQLTLVIGQYAQAWHLPEAPRTLTETVRHWRDWWPTLVPLPHPSPRNQRWLRQNPWFEQELLPVLRERIAELLS